VVIKNIFYLERTSCLLKNAEDCKTFGDNRLFETSIPIPGYESLLARARLNVAQLGDLVLFASILFYFIVFIE
jgi:hypothetical protein